MTRGKQFSCQDEFIKNDRFTAKVCTTYTKIRIFLHKMSIVKYKNLNNKMQKEDLADRMRFVLDIKKQGLK